MISPSEIKSKAEKIYVKYLQNVVAGIPFDEIIVPCDKKPSKDFSQYLKEHEALYAASQEIRGFGYSIEWEEVNHKTLGKQKLPQKISFKTERDLLKFIHKEKEVEQLKKDVAIILKTCPKLADWIQKYPQKVIDYAQQWSDLLKVLTYFQQHPKPNLYIRELPIEVHTKFVEQHKSILRELLDLIVADYVQATEKRFETHFNLKYDEELIRIRFLDSNLSVTYGAGMNDISLPISEFCALNWKIESVFVVENKVNFLTFPAKKGAILIWGHGYGIACLKKAAFLQHTPLYYWGDLDAQGFEILSQFRGYFPQTQSIFMNRKTFDRFFENEQGTASKVTVELHLNAAEQSLYELLKTNQWRLEQEKIPHSYVKAFLSQGDEKEKS